MDQESAIQGKIFHGENFPPLNFKATKEELKFMRDSKATKQPLGILQEMLSRRSIVPVYELIKTEAPAGHLQNYWFRVVFEDGKMTYFAEGSGRSKKAAKHDAARNLIEILCGSPGNGPNQKANADAGEQDDAHPIRRLSQLCAERRWPTPMYDMEVGDPEESLHTIVCSVLEYREVAKGFSKKAAKRLAAQQMCVRLLEEPIIAEEVQQKDGGELTNKLKMIPVTQVGKKMVKIQKTCLKNTKIDHKKLLEEIAAENKFDITYVDIEEASFTGQFQCLVMISMSPVGICHGTGASVEEAHSNAAQNGLEYLKIVTRKGKSIEQAIAKINLNL
ncbi:interferon-inducible double-stranded RNA-dependent protein kinase activator A homolog [Drosophila biarmipes]|uniref:interferon-inducible double-stranded RNA-dependent protein kinase activator A homolog n=1 Tax=Drosophila biarmipes TaxID=125945 RepID=UPI0007E879B1|nr:interferon-inducible double-stranded RNA-dependent protein kinase activator A homolog [Drosophila biarmipes]